MLDTTKKFGVTLLYMIPGGGFFFARNVAGESFSGIRNRLHRQICAAVVGVETPSSAAVRQLGILAENRHRNFDVGPGSRHHESLPGGTFRNGDRRNEAENKGRQQAKPHQDISDSAEIIEWICICSTKTVGTMEAL
jgi:hypothetical protein